MSRVFDSFRDASFFAKQQSVNSKTLHCIKKNESNWVVLSKYEKYEQNKVVEKDTGLKDSDLHERVEALEKRLELLETLQKEKEQKKKERKQRKRLETEEKHLKERREYYLSLPEEELEALWPNSDQLKDRERSLLKSTIRHVKGYDSPGAFSVKKPMFCTTCYMSKEDCKCDTKIYHKDKSWW